MILRRFSGAALMVLGAVAGGYAVFGAPHYWIGASSLGRLAFGVVEFGALSGGAWLLASRDTDRVG